MVAVNDEIFLTILGTAAGILVLTGFIPQVLRSYKRKKMDDVSTFLMLLIGSGMFLWIIYGINRSDPTIIGANVAGLSLNLLLLGMKFRYRNNIHPI